MDKDGEMTEPQTMPVGSSNCVPTLARLATLAMADRIVDGRLPIISEPIPASYSNEIFEVLRERRQLDSRTLEIMSPDKFQITKMNLSGGEGRISLFDLTFCSRHVLSSFCLGDIDYPMGVNKIPAADVFTRFANKKTRQTLRHIDLSGRNRISSNWPHHLAKYTGIESLSFANRATTISTLVAVATQFDTLKRLDISNTLITDISAVSNLKSLEVLIMFNLNILSGKVVDTLGALTKLRVLDISRKNNTDFLQETSQDASVDMALALYNKSAWALTTRCGSPWPELRALDMSGLSLGQLGADTAMNFVRTILEAHPNLEQLAVLGTSLDSQTITHVGRSWLRVINASSRRSVLDALSYYTKMDRSGFTAHALHAVYYLLQSGYDEFSQDELGECLRLVCLSMEQFLTTLAVQIAGSACLYHICKMKRIRRLSVKDVCLCIERSLDAAQTYRNMTQLQKNVWLTICNDYLLHLPGVDFYRTCKVALDTMITNRDASVERMTIAIVSIVTPKMRAPEARHLTADARYVKHLVKIMGDYLSRYQMQAPHDHDNTLYTLKFTLSALWNLTDECEVTCAAFLESGGVETAFEILRVFNNHSSVQTKVLGILNNIAEVEELKLNILCRCGYVEQLLECLEGDFTSCDNRGRHRHVERSYFAAGVLANILLIGEDEWSGGVLREAVDAALLRSVSRWPELATAMVSYRSFDPFCRIIDRANSNGAVLWCLWGVNHVLTHRETHNPSHCAKGYVGMLRESKLLDVCLGIVGGRIDAHSLVVELAQRVVEESLGDSPAPSPKLETNKVAFGPVAAPMRPRGVLADRQP